MGRNTRASVQNILAVVQNITENQHFVSNRETQFVSDARRDGIGAALKQQPTDGWITIAAS